MNYKKLLAIALSFVAVNGAFAAGDQDQPADKGSCLTQKGLPAVGILGDAIEIFALTGKSALLRQAGALAGTAGAIAEATDAYLSNKDDLKRALALGGAEAAGLNLAYRTAFDRYQTVTHAADTAEIVENMSEEEFTELKNKQTKQWYGFVLNLALYLANMTEPVKKDEKLSVAVPFARMLLNTARHWHLHKAYKGVNDQVVVTA